MKNALEWMFLTGELATAGRRGFERVYALPEQVLDAAILDREVPEEEAIDELVDRSMRALGVGVLKEIADYFRLSQAQTRASLLRLVEAGAIEAITVREWNKPAWIHRDARRPRRIEATALLSPFDPVVWERERALRMFGFHYRIEIYTPAPQRVYGYYTLPVLVDEALVGRVDLKNDRQRGVLRVQSAWSEPGAPAHTIERIVPELRAMAAWQGLDDVEVVDRGDLARELAGALRVGVRDPG